MRIFAMLLALAHSRYGGCPVNFVTGAMSVDFLGTFGQMNGAYPGWTDLESKLSAYEIS